MPRIRRSLPCLALAGAATALLLTGCSIQDRMCGSDSYPVKAVRDTGGDCVANGQEPPEGWVRYPEGKVPEYVGDKWDVYWGDKLLDEKGRLIETP
ncbi:SCO0607 family lipoprotein [Streptomyces sp. NPDC047928]|uniref:SCO0607 family lipoprotein n=1 Tax=unclassified Streptomyces TaxID=2593676 RepID=UPI0037195451